MTISIPCPLCQRQLKIPDKAAGRRIKCPSCESSLTVPQADSMADDEDLYSDPYDDSPLPPRRRSTKSTSKTQTTTAKKSEATARKSLHPAVVPIAATAVGVLMGAIVVSMFSKGGGEAATAPLLVPGATVANPTPSDPAAEKEPEPAAVAVVPPPAPINVTVMASTGPLVQLTGADTPEAALQQMLATLQKHDYENFVVNYAPVDMFRKYRDSETRVQVLQQFPGPELLHMVEQMAAAKPTVDPSGMMAVVEHQVTAAPAATQEPVGEGYGGELPAVLDGAIADLESGKFQDFVMKIFPPEAIRMMKSGPEGSVRLDAINPESSALERMKTDLQFLKTVTPVIEGDVAEYTVPPQSGVVRPNPNGLQPPDRRVRFSRINGHWRFYAGVTSEQLANANSGSGKLELQLERVGPAWRLLSMPRL